MARRSLFAGSGLAVFTFLLVPTVSLSNEVTGLRRPKVLMPPSWDVFDGDCFSDKEGWRYCRPNAKIGISQLGMPIGTKDRLYHFQYIRDRGTLLAMGRLLPPRRSWFKRPSLATPWTPTAELLSFDLTFQAVEGGKRRLISRLG